MKKSFNVIKLSQFLCPLTFNCESSFQSEIIPPASEVAFFTRYSLVSTRYSFLFYSLLVAFLLATRWIILVTPYGFTRYSLGFYSLFVPFYSLPKMAKSSLDAGPIPLGMNMLSHHNNVKASSNIARKN